MASLDHHLNPLFSINECMTCGALYTVDFCCSKGDLEDKILDPKPPQNCATYGNPVDGSYCRHCVFLQKCFNEGWYTIHDENEILNTSKSSNHNTNVVSTPREPFVFNQDPGENSSQNPLQINHNCCYKYGALLDGIFCQRCTCKSCGNGAHIGYNCPPKVPIISNPEQCNQTINELPQTLPSVHPTCNYEDENSFIYDSKPNSFNDSPSVLTYPPQLQFETYLCELCGNNARYGYDCPPQFLLVYEQEPYYYEQNSCYAPNSFSFDQYQSPQFPINYPPQETSREILQARKDLMEAIQAFLKEYDHIPSNEKCMALLLAEERFLKIKQVMREEQNQPGVMQELLLKLLDDLQSLKGSKQEKKEMAAQSFIPYWNSSMIDDEEARDNFLKDVFTFLRKFSRIPFGITPKVILIAWESFGEIKEALMDKQYRQEDIQELMSKLLEDVRNISEEFLEYINCPSWNRSLFYFDDEYTVIWRSLKAITPDEPFEEPEDPLIMGENELNTIPEKDKSKSLLSQDILITSPKIDFLSEEFTREFTPIPPGMDEDEFDEEEVDCYDHDISSDDDSYENIEYVEASPLNLEYENEDQEEKEFDLEDIFQIQDIILREKLLNVHRLITNIKSLKNNPTPDHMFKFPSLVPISITDSGSFFEESDTFLSYSDNSLPEFETFSDHTKETRSGRGLTRIVISTNPLLKLPECESFHFNFHPSFPRPPSEPPDVEISLVIEINAPVINDFDKLNGDEDFNQGEIILPINVEDVNSFTFVIWIFLPYLTYSEVSPLLSSTRNEDTIFDPGIST
ncbi:hypothetical protein Tco_1043229 [Tanacetum coccineum]|uniref:CCHC-type domain-containing protein n=1 Tax=Tanacetum coccineum TaxID=301880 RepID=A0ABQ5GMS7_9ASTR